MTTIPDAYRKLLERSREIALVEGAGQVLSWDQETYMPAQGLAFRADQLAHLGGWSHRLFVAPEVGDWIRACEDAGLARESDEAANVREWRRAYDRKVKLPPALVEEFQRTQSFAREAWVEARRKSEYAIFLPHFRKLLSLNREMAARWGYEQTPYDALLESYEPGARAAALQTLFDDLRPRLAELARAAVETARRTPPDVLRGEYPIAAQQAFNREVAEAFGFDFDAGRIDTTAHPFCTGLGPGDCRLTTRYDERDFTESLYSVLHEAGHGLYEQGLRREAHGTPLGSAASLGIHESQSRLWENHVGRSRAFWEHWLPRACVHFPALRRFTPETVTAAVNRVAPSFIRVEAGEVTYDLHILLRFQIERRLIEETLRPEDVPAVWNEEFKSLLGLEVPDDARGCLQDIHWSLGTLGYFPTYTLGNLNASQLMRAARRDLPALEAELRQGRYASLLGWLREKIHRQGQRWEPGDLMAFATGESTGASHHLLYLREKFDGVTAD